MRWRTAALAVVGVAVLAAVIVLYWPRASPAASWDTIPPEAQPMIVSDVLSGDTVILLSDRPGSQVYQWGAITAKLGGVDAPNFGLIDECFAEEAQGRLSGLLPEGSVAWVKTDVSMKDELGRWRAYVWAEDGRLVNQVLAVDGYVRSDDAAGSDVTPDDDPLASTVHRAVAQAAARFGGLWGECR